MNEITPLGRFLGSPVANGIDRVMRNPLEIFDAFDYLPVWVTDTTRRVTGGFSVDVKDLGDSYEVKADIPGAKKEDIAVELDDDGVLKLSYEHSEQDGDDSESGYIRRERKVSGMRTILLEGSMKDTAKAEYKDGVLTITVDKDTDGKKLPEAHRVEVK